ncbi:hypothetical protein DI487_13210 [Flavobacterium sediminis]|uniref:Uncharacterized protein n=1 Tax=Flavobacterium sediminis TaxID=2201181 RepID=A0A2U8QWY5_9FLAO|nr:hypothetical protein [Flavobacterium sediminis]AWM14720.1 hypothetical protein DI487_13210 [Flavobacterium sediminis]
MKKMSLVIAGIALLGIVACNEKKEESPENVAVEQEAAPQQEETDGTSLSVSEDGVEFSTQDGEKKTEIDINTSEEEKKEEK